MKRILTLSLVFIFLGTQISFAQKYQGNYDLLLAVGKTTLPENVDVFIANQALSKSETQAPYYYRYVQFKEMPTLAEQEAIKATGLQLLEYIPHKTYVVAFPKGFDAKKLSALNIRSIAKIDGAHKIHHLLSAEELPAWAVARNDIDVIIMYHKGFPQNKMMSTFFSRGYKILKLSEQERVATVRIPQSDIQAVANLHFVRHIGAINPPPVKEDILGGSLQRSTSIRNNFPGGRNYTGEGVSLLCRDDGVVGPHIDFQGSMINLTTDLTGTHGDGVSGILCGAGNLDPTAVGMAPHADLYVINYQANFLDNTLSLHQNDNVMITNSSYSDGCNAGYTTGTVTVDNQIWTNQTLIHWFSAGNSNNQNCGYGAGDQWGNITGGHKIGKNVVATANLFPDESLVASSSRGPASDGRIKPDLAANGQNHVSTDPNNGYQSFGGTSGASPAAAGAAAQLYEAYRTLNGGANPKSGLIKAVMMNTAEDLGNDGPDFRYGYGRVNALRAVQVLEDTRYLEDSVSQGGTNTHSITVPAGVSELRIMTYWMEPPGSISAAFALVNDLDMEVTEPGGTMHQPLVLDPTPNATTLNNPAVEKRDSLNNVEQVVVTNPAAGVYTVDVDGNVIPSGTPKYWVIYEFIMDEIVLTYPMGGEGFLPSSTERIHWDAPQANSGSFTLEYSDDNGGTWSNIGTATSTERFFDWNVPNIANDDVLVRITRGSNTDQSLPLTIIGRPNNVQFDTICGNKISISWDSMATADAYEVYLLGNKYMDSVGTTTNASITISGNYNLSQDQWVAVAAIKDNGVGLRTIAVQHGPGLLNCVVADDIAVEIISPKDVEVSCATGPINKNIQVKLTNTGINDQHNFLVSQSFNGAVAVDELYTDTILSGQSDIFTFSVPVVLTIGNTYDLVAWSNLANDGIKFNDTVSTTIDVLQTTVATVSYQHDFESFSTCGTSSNCGAEICQLNSGWINVTNGQGDDIDWRVDAGGTPSNGTGPSNDHKPGNNSGQYLYTEASSGCNFQEAVLLSPCFDMTNATLAELSLWYHMFGGDMGELHIDIFDGSAWNEDVIPPISGDKGNVWRELTVDLSPYNGATINVRIRGITGGGFESDIAIDDFKINLINTPPAPAFSASQVQPCPNETITLLDQSLNSPSAWNWSITPNTYQFVNGTSASDQNPEVAFSAVGNYDIKLVATNVNGSDSLIQFNFITVNNGNTIPLVEDFQAIGFPPSNWDIGNPDGGTTWQENTVVGTVTNNTQAAYMDNFNYNAVGEEDYLTSFALDLSNAFTPELTFDVAYARYSAAFHDSLRVDISTDCGATFIEGVYLKGDSDLATVADETGVFSPSSAADWRNEVISLTNYVGGSIVIRFTAINGWGNQLYIDNINIQDPLSPPTADFITGAACITGTLFTDNSTNATNHVWDFGAGATPQTANTAGPHTVTYGATGMKTVQLIVNNINGADTILQTIDVGEVPTAGFTFVDLLANGFVDFTNTSTGANNYLWTFGDGTTSTDPNPSHKYTTMGTYTVTLEAFNDCGSNSTTFTVMTTNTFAPENILEVNVFPNPNKGQFNVTVDGANEDLEMSIIDIQGRVLQSEHFGKVGTSFQTNINLGDAAAGVYILRLQTKNNVKNVRIVKY